MTTSTTSTRKHFIGGLLIVSEAEPIDIMGGNAMAGSHAGMVLELRACI